MRKLSLMLFVSLLSSFTLMAQTSARGVIKAAGTGNPLSGVTITLLQQNISTQTNEKGEFTLSYLQSGDEELSISHDGYFTQIKLINLKAKTVNDFGIIELKADAQEETKQETTLQLSEKELTEDEGRVSQNTSTTLSSKGDIYNSQASYSFSPMRFNVRGYDNDYESTYINGVHFNGMERGGFNYSAFGGLNDAMRNQDNADNLSASSFTFGNLGGATNINTRATGYAAGSKGGVAFSNRSYKVRGSILHATGLQSNGWAFAASAAVRWADEGVTEGTFYKSVGYFLSAEKVFNKNHSLSIVTFGSPTERGQSSSATDEVYSLANSIYYNSYWGYQNGVKRNSRIVKSFDPTIILSHEFKIDDKQILRTGLAYHYSFYSNSALNFFNAPDPRPDYYRNLPSYQYDGQVGLDGSINGVPSQNMINELTKNWRDRNPIITQIDWQTLYNANVFNNEKNPSGNAKYALERRHNNLMETTFNSTYTNQLNKELKITAGVEAKSSKGIHYKTMDDLMGANQWIDIDQFAERDLTGLLKGKDPSISQNDLRNPNRIIKNGDKFGYDYDIDILSANAFLQNQWTFYNVDLFYAAKMTYTQFSRFGRMENGRATADSVQSYGRGKTWWTASPSVKGGFVYKIDSKKRIIINALAEYKAPLPNNAYVSPRIKDVLAPGLSQEKILSYDLTYAFTYPGIRGRITAFQTYSLNGVELSSYYDDSYQTFINHSLSGVNKVYSGIELGMEVKLNSNFKLVLAGTISDHHYTDSVTGVLSPENGAFADEKDIVMLKGIKIASGPQTAGSIALDYFNPKMWFATLTLNYFDNNYLDVAPLRFTKKYLAMYTTDIEKNVLGAQERLKGGFMLDASIGKVIYLKNRQSLNINLSANNLLNSNLKTGGFQQARVPIDKGAIYGNVYKFPPKYYYALGINFFATISYKF
ncbi:MAG: carboxypeptidase-like regulatory domain-containing protein [Paludibacter sp.]